MLIDNEKWMNVQCSDRTQKEDLKHNRLDCICHNTVKMLCDSLNQTDHTDQVHLQKITGPGQY